MLAKSLAAAVAALSLSLVTSAHGAVVQFSGIEAGVEKTALLDEATGLEWLSPRHTVGLTYSQTLQGSWVQDRGFRFATQAELVELLNNAGAEIGPPTMAGSPNTVGHVEAMKRVITLLGSTYVNNLPSQGDDFGQQSVYGVTSDVYPDGWAQYGEPSHTYAYFTATPTTAYLRLDGQWRWDSSESLMGAFLVRVTTAVPEPSGVLLFAAGAAVVALGRGRHIVR
jgi:hypothetical protein